MVPRVEPRPQRRALRRVVAGPRVVGRRLVSFRKRRRHSSLSLVAALLLAFQQPAAVRAAALRV